MNRDDKIQVTIALMLFIEGLGLCAYAFTLNNFETSFYFAVAGFLQYFIAIALLVRIGSKTTNKKVMILEGLVKELEKKNLIQTNVILTQEGIVDKLNKVADVREKLLQKKGGGGGLK